MALVLCTGADELLMSTRKSILEQAGHDVTTAMGEQELTEACANHSFDVAVIGQATHRNEKRRVLRLIREHCPKAKILELFTLGSGRILTNADDWLEVPFYPPTQLPERVSRLSSKPTSSKSRSPSRNLL